jgi:hypothetical protein
MNSQKCKDSILGCELNQRGNACGGGAFMRKVCSLFGDEATSDRGFMACKSFWENRANDSKSPEELCAKGAEKMRQDNGCQ